MSQRIAGSIWPMVATALAIGLLFWLWTHVPIPYDLNLTQWRWIWVSITTALAIVVALTSTAIAWKAVAASAGVVVAAVYTEFTFPSDTGHSLCGASLDALDLFWMEMIGTPIVFLAVGLVAGVIKRSI